MTKKKKISEIAAPPSARARKPKAGERSKPELAWEKEGYRALLDLPEFAGCAVVVNRYEGVTFLLPGGRYTPDYFVLLSDGRVVLVEVKGSKFQPSYRDSRAKLRSCATLNPWFTFVMALAPTKAHGWMLEVVPPDRHDWVGKEGVYDG